MTPAAWITRESQKLLDLASPAIMINMRSKANRNLVTFKSSSFNTTEAMPYFIQPDCFGDDLANWLIDQLTFRDNRTYEKPSQRDYD